MRAANSRRHRPTVLLLVLLLVSGVTTLLGASPAAAVDPSVHLTVTPTVSTAATHERVEFRLQFRVDDAPLTGGQIRVELPKTLWTSTDLVMTGGASTSRTAVDPNHVLVWTLDPTVPAGDTYEVEFTARTLHSVLPHGTTVTVAATLTGSNTPPVSAVSAPVTLTAQVEVEVTKTGLSAVPAPGPANTAVAGDPGFDVRYRIRPRAVCSGATVGSLMPTGCVRAVGAVTDTLPAGSYLTGVTATRPTAAALADWDTAIFGPNQSSPFDLVGSTPPNIGAQPNVGPGGSFTVPVVTFSRRTWPTVDGTIDQVSAFDDPCPVVGFCPVDIFDDNNPPELEVVIWVPASVAPGFVANQVTFTADDGRGTSISSSSTANQFVTADNQLHLEKTAALCTGGHTYPGSNRPAAGCFVPRYQPKLFNLEVSTIGSVLDPVVTDQIPAGLLFESAPVPPAGWTLTYTTLAGCDETTPATSFTAVAPNADDVTCLRWSYTGVFAGIAVLQARLRHDPAVTLAPGTFQLVTNHGVATASNAPTVSSDRPVWLANVWEGGAQKLGPSVLTPGEPFQYTLLVGDQHLYGDVGPTDLVVEDVLPVGLDYLGHTVELAPAAFNGGTLPVSCQYTPSTRVFRCDAPGRAADMTAAGLIFRVVVDVQLSSPVTATEIRNTACAWAGSQDGPVDDQGRPLTWYVNEAEQSCSLTVGAVHAVVALGNSKHLIAPASGPIEPGDLLTYGIDYNHVLPDSTVDLVNGYVYDILGRHPATGALVGGAVPEFVSATVGDAAAVEYTCATTGLTVANASNLTWSASATCPVTAVRWRLPSPYLRTAPPGSVMVTVRAPLTTPHSSTIVNHSAIVGDGLLPATSSPVVTDVSRPTDLSIDKTHGAGFGENPTFSGTWTLTVTNQGAADVGANETVTVVDTLPNQVTPVAAAGIGWSCSTAGQTVTCTRTGPLAAGSSFAPITVLVHATAGTYTNTATVSTTGFDPVPGNDVDTDTVSVRAEVSARAWGVVATLPLVGTIRLGDTGEVVARNDQHVDRFVATATVRPAPLLPPILSARLVSGVVDIADGPAGQGPWTGDAEGLIDRVDVNVAGISILAEDVVAESSSTCGATQQSVTIGRLVVNGVPIVIPTPAPNTTLNLGVASITLNERVGGAVTAIRVQALGLIDVRIAYARSAVACG